MNRRIKPSIKCKGFLFHDWNFKIQRVMKGKNCNVYTYKTYFCKRCYQATGVVIHE